MKKPIVLLICFMSVAGMMASGFVSNGLAYNVTSSTARYTVEVTGGVSYPVNVIIPATVTNNDTIYAVTGIGSYAFERSYIQTIVIPKSVKYIGRAAFQISNLQSIIIPDSVTMLSSYLFNGCSFLYSITIPKSVHTIQEQVFYGCTSLVSITIPTSVKSIGQGVFDGCYSLMTVTVPNSVTSLGDWVFDNCWGLKSVILSDSLPAIEDYSFMNCMNLTSVTIPQSVRRVGYSAFSRCSVLKTVTLPDSVTYIGEWAFSFCNNRTSFYANPVTPVDLTNSGTAFFSSPVSTCTLHVPKGSKTAYENAAVWKSFSTIAEDIYDDVQSIREKEINIIVTGNKAFISSLTVNEPVRIIGIDGKIIFEQRSIKPTMEITLPASGIYIICAGGKKVRIFCFG